MIPDHLVHLRSRWARIPVHALQAAAALFLPRKILRGPFAGLRVVGGRVGSARLPKILGTYEEEMTAFLYEALSAPQSNMFLDVGCAGGYYLGIAAQIMNPSAKIVGLDRSERAVADAKKALAEFSNIEVLCRSATSELITSVIGTAEHPIVLIDIEGAERELMGTIGAHAFRRATVIVEVHRFAGASVEDIAETFQRTHVVRVVPFKCYAHRGLATLPFVHEMRHPATDYLLAMPR